jgi:hypothetical protein
MLIVEQFDVPDVLDVDSLPVGRALAIGSFRRWRSRVSRSGGTIVAAMAMRVDPRRPIHLRHADDVGGFYDLLEVRPTSARRAVPRSRRLRWRSSVGVGGEALRSTSGDPDLRRLLVSHRPGWSCSRRSPPAGCRNASCSGPPGFVAGSSSRCRFHQVAAFIWIFNVVDGLTTPRTTGCSTADPRLGTNDGGRDPAGGDQPRNVWPAVLSRGEGWLLGAGLPDDLRAGQAADRGVFARQRVGVQAGGDDRGSAARMRRVPDERIHGRSRPRPSRCWRSTCRLITSISATSYCGT